MISPYLSRALLTPKDRQQALREATVFWSEYKPDSVGCDWGNLQRRVEVPAGKTHPDFITCNACWRRRGYLYVLPCNPRVVGWPHDWLGAPAANGCVD